MNGLISRMSGKKKKKQLLAQHDHGAYPFSQISKFINAYLSKDNELIALAAQAVFYWPSFSQLFSENEEVFDDDIPSVSFVNFRRKSAKKKKRILSKGKAQGESVSDESSISIKPLDVAGEQVKSKVSIKGKSPSFLTKSPIENPEIQTDKNWKDWNSKIMNKITLADYTKWLNSFKKEEAPSAPKARKKPKAKRKKKSVSNSIKARLSASVDLNEEIVSEPLADLLSEQGHNDQAISMYEKLSLIFPEKSSFFAVKIKDLKSK